MQTTPMRHAPRSSRVPLDDVLIELSHDELDAPFEADGVNVGAGGLSMRSSLLPDIGSRLRCRFDSPADGQPVTASCEVVWAADSGKNLGEIGLRFTEIDTHSALALRRLIDDLDTDASGENALEAEPLAEAYADAYEDAQDAYEAAASGEPPATVELRLDGVASPLLAELVEASRDGAVVEQELPFLRIGTGITDEAGRMGHLSAVDLRLEGDLPRLVLTLRYDDAAGCLELCEPPEQTPPTVREQAPLAAVAVAAAPPVLEEGLDTIPDTLSADDGEGDVDGEADAGWADAPVVSAVAAVSAPAPKVVERPRAPRLELEPAPMDGRDLIDDLRAKLIPAYARARAYVATMVARFAPAMRRFFTRARAEGLGVVGQARPVVERSVVRSVATVRRFIDVLVQRAGNQPARKTQKRRQQGGRAAAAAAAAAATDLPPSAVRRRRLLLGMLAVLALLGAYGALRSEPVEDPAAPVSATPGAAPSAPSAAPAAPGATPAPSAYGAPAPSAYGAPGPVSAAPPSTPRAMPEPALEAGPIPSPTFPTVAAERAPSAPVVAELVNDGDSFGAAAVPGGTPFTLNMSTSVQAIHGSAEANGFKVVIPGSLSLSRAGPIAENHPLVEHAAIRNRGDSAELSIRFDPGASPLYRVEARGTRLVVIIGT